MSPWCLAPLTLADRLSDLGENLDRVRCADSTEVGKYSDAEARAIIVARVGEGVEFLEDYPGTTKVKWRMKCPLGHNCEPRLNTVLSYGRGICVPCGGAKQYTNIEAMELVVSRFGVGVEFLSQYPGNANIPWKMKCPRGHMTSPTLGHIKASKRGVCRECSRRRMAYSDAEARAKVTAIHGNAVVFREAYPGNNKSPWDMICPVGHHCSPSLHMAINPHKQKSLCGHPDCADYTFDKYGPAVVYRGSFVYRGRVGIVYGKTGNPLDRYSHYGRVLDEFSLMDEVSFATGLEATDAEQEISKVLEAAGVASCSSYGLSASGAITESFFLDEIPPAALMLLDSIFGMR